MPLTRVDTHELPADQGEIRAFVPVRNEMLRLPHLLDYHRQLGVNRFFIIDNNSTDETTAYLAPFKDCHVFFTSDSYIGAGVPWLNELMSQYAVGHWAVYVDGDELLTYPNQVPGNLPLFCRWLDDNGFEAVYALMLDMYADKPLQDVNYQQGAPFAETTPWFDGDYQWASRPGIPGVRPAFPPQQILGGPRTRICYPNLMHRSTAFHWMHAVASRLAHKAGIKSELLERAPLNFKMPLVRFRANSRYITSHWTTPLRIAPVTGTLLHFKYFQDFAARVNLAVTEGEHYDAASEYARYAKHLEYDKGFSLTYAASKRYTGPRSLVEAGLMKSTPGWDAYAGNGRA